MPEPTRREYLLAEEAEARAGSGLRELREVILDVLVQYRVELEDQMVHYLRQASNDQREGRVRRLGELMSVMLAILAAEIERGEHRA